MTYRKIKQKGSALISALILILLISSIATAWISQTHHHIRQQLRLEENLQAQSLTDGAKIWTISILQKTKFRQTKALIARLPVKTLSLPPHWKMEAELIDAQSQLNLNTITEQSMRLVFYMLLKDVLKDTENAPINDIYYATLSWIDPALLKQRFMQYQAQYAKAKPPYQSGGQPMLTLAEWRKVYGMTPMLYKKLQSFITALPESLPININTCDPRIISHLTPDLKPAQVKKFLFARGDRGFQTNQELFAILEEFKIPVQNITTQSQYFWLMVKISAPSGRQFQSKYLIYRQLKPKSKPNKVIVLQQFNHI